MSRSPHWGKKLIRGVPSDTLKAMYITMLRIRGEADLRSYKVGTLKARELLGSWLFILL
jgi:hypothetical protein